MSADVDTVLTLLEVESGTPKGREVRAALDRLAAAEARAEECERTFKRNLREATKELRRERDGASRESDERGAAMNEARAALAAAEAQRDTLADFLREMLRPEWWREEIDVNGEYTTTRGAGYYEVVPKIRAALAEAGVLPGDSAANDEQSP